MKIEAWIRRVQVFVVFLGGATSFCFLVFFFSSEFRPSLPYEYGKKQHEHARAFPVAGLLMCSWIVVSGLYQGIRCWKKTTRSLSKTTIVFNTLVLLGIFASAMTSLATDYISTCYPITHAHFSGFKYTANTGSNSGDYNGNGNGNGGGRRLMLETRSHSSIHTHEPVASNCSVFSISLALAGIYTIAYLVLFILELVAPIAATPSSKDEKNSSDPEYICVQTPQPTSDVV